MRETVLAGRTFAIASRILCAPLSHGYDTVSCPIGIVSMFCYAGATVLTPIVEGYTCRMEQVPRARLLEVRVAPMQGIVARFYKVERDSTMAWRIDSRRYVAAR